MKWLTPKQVSEITGFATQTLANWRVLDKGPAFRHVGKSVRYASVDVDAFMLNGQQSAASPQESQSGP